MGQVIELFGTPPAAEDDPKVAAFVEDHLLEFLSAVTLLDAASTREEVNEQMEEVRRVVASWPRRL